MATSCSKITVHSLTINKRQRVLTAPVQPTTLEPLIIPEEFMRT